MLPAPAVRSVLLGIAALLTWFLGESQPLFAQSVDHAADVEAAALRPYLTANGLLNRGLYELAAPEYRAFLKDHPEHEKAPIARYGLGVCLFRLDKPAEAVETLMPLRAIERFAFAAEVRTMLGQCALAQQKYAAAVELFAEVTRDFGTHDLASDAGALRVEALVFAEKPNEAVAAATEFAQRWPNSSRLDRVLYFDAVARVGLRDRPGAIEKLTELSRQFPNSPLIGRAALLLGQTFQQENKLDAAAEAFRRVAGDGQSPLALEALNGLGEIALAKGEVESATQAFERVIQAGGDAAVASRARFGRARCAFESGDSRAAAAAFEELAASGPAELRDAAAYWAARCALRQNDGKLAAARLRAALEQYPQSALRAEMMFGLATALLRCDDAEGALREIAALVKQFPESALLPEALALHAVLEHQRGKFDASAALCAEFAKRFADHPAAARVAFLAAENEFLSGRLERAAELFQKFQSQFPSDSQVAKSRYRLGLALGKLNRWDAGEPLLMAIATPTCPDEFRGALTVLGDLNFERKNWSEAERWYSAYLAGGSEAAGADGALLKLGLARQRQDKLDAALQAFDQLLARFPESPQRVQARFERAQVLVEQGQLDPAQREFQRVLDEEPTGRFAPYALRHLAQLSIQREKPGEAEKYLAQLASQTGGDSSLADEAAAQRAALLVGKREFADAERLLCDLLPRLDNKSVAAAARVNLVIALARQEKSAEALREIGMIESDGAELSAAQRGDVLYEKAWCLRAEERGADAAAVYQQIINAGGSNAATATIELAELKADAKEFQAALTLLTSARDGDQFAALSPDLRRRARYRLGICAIELQQYAEGAAALARLIEEFPQGPLTASASYFAGEAALKLNQLAAAATHFERAAKLSTDENVVAASLLQLGDTLAAQQRWPESERTFAAFLERFADHERWYQARFGVGVARENQNRGAEAIDAYREVTARHEGQTAARAQFQIGECLFAQKKHDEAARELLKVEILYAYPEWSAAAVFEAGRCFEALKKLDEARKQYAHVTEKYADTNWAASARRAPRRVEAR